MTSSNNQSNKRAVVVGIGTIGGSVASGLRARGWHVTGTDLDEERAREACRSGILDATGIDLTAAVTFIATPVSGVVAAAAAALGRGGIVTDVGSVKGGVVRAISHPQFVGGHPMAGSESSGLDGVNPDLFEGATWVLTPGPHTDPTAYLEVRNIVNELGASVITLDADQHDEIVATISHVPHLTATALMSVALEHAGEHDTVLRLAAGGFRDMTRIAAGHPGLWADIAFQNRDAIVDGLGRLAATLEDMQELIAGSNREELEKVLEQAAIARRGLHVRGGRPTELVEVSVVIPDRPGALGEVFGIFADVGVNVEDVDINHAVEGKHGTLLLTVDANGGDKVREALKLREFRVSVTQL